MAGTRSRGVGAKSQAKSGSTEVPRQQIISCCHDSACKMLYLVGERSLMRKGLFH